MQFDAVEQRLLQPLQRLGLVPFARAFLRKRGALMTLDDLAVGDDDGLARQDALDAGENRVAPRRELQLQQFRLRAGIDRRRREAAGDQRLRLRGEGEAVLGLGIVERLDAEGVARQHEVTRFGIVQGERVHAAQLVDEIDAVAAVEVERRLPVGAGREVDAVQLPAQLAVVVDPAVGDERSTARLDQRLGAAFEIDDRQAVVHEADIADEIVLAPVRPAMDQGLRHAREHGAVGPLAAGGHQSGNAAHGRFRRSAQSIRDDPGPWRPR